MPTLFNHFSSPICEGNDFFVTHFGIVVVYDAVRGHPEGTYRRNTAHLFGVGLNDRTPGPIDRSHSQMTWHVAAAIMEA